jgi:hypothetical protein
MNDNNIGTIILLKEKYITNSLLTKGIGLLKQQYDHINSCQMKAHYSTNFYGNHSSLVLIN